MSLRHAILGVLEFAPLHGYALKCVLEEGISAVWPVNLAAIYPCLHKLEEDGLVQHEMHSGLTGRPDRKVFSITSAGRSEMAHWRKLPPERGDIQIKSPLLLKLLFSKPENLPEVREWLDDTLEETTRNRDRLRAALTADSGSAPFFIRFLRETGLQHVELEIERMTKLRGEVSAMIETKQTAVELGIELSPTSVS
jgi:DNA-binding PadR family transcriptional regulator